MPYLLPEFIIEIALYLDNKSLLTMSSISKDISQLLNSNNFYRMKLNNLKYKEIYFIKEYHGKQKFLKLFENTLKILPNQFEEIVTKYNISRDIRIIKLEGTSYIYDKPYRYVSFCNYPLDCWIYDCIYQYIEFSDIWRTFIKYGFCKITKKMYEQCNSNSTSLYVLQTKRRILDIIRDNMDVLELI